MGEVEELSQTYFWTCLSNSPTVSLFPLSLPTHGFRQIKNFNTRHLKEKGKRDFCVWILQRESEREFMPILEFSYFSSQVTAVLGRRVVLKIVVHVPGIHLNSLGQAQSWGPPRLSELEFLEFGVWQIAWLTVPRMVFMNPAFENHRCRHSA